jgi:syntaxin 1B/2/3
MYTSFYTRNDVLNIHSSGYIDKAVVSARAARKKRWICFFITLILLAIVAIIVAVVVTQNLKPKPKP